MNTGVHSTAATHAHVRNLADMLQETRQFCDDAAQRAAGDQRERHRQRALACAAMLRDIHRWHAHVRQFPEASDHAVPHPGATGPHGLPAAGNESHAALIHRISCMYSAIAVVKNAAQKRVTDDPRRRVRGSM